MAGRHLRTLIKPLVTHCWNHRPKGIWGSQAVGGLRVRLSSDSVQRRELTFFLLVSFYFFLLSDSEGWSRGEGATRRFWCHWDQEPARGQRSVAHSHSFLSAELLQCDIYWTFYKPIKVHYLKKKKSWSSDFGVEMIPNPILIPNSWITQRDFQWAFWRNI